MKCVKVLCANCKRPMATVVFNHGVTTSFIPGFFEESVYDKDSGPIISFEFGEDLRSTITCPDCYKEENK